MGAKVFKYSTRLRKFLPLLFRPIQRSNQVQAVYRRAMETPLH